MQNTETPETRPRGLVWPRPSSNIPVMIERLGHAGFVLSESIIEDVVDASHRINTASIPFRDIAKKHSIHLSKLKALMRDAFDIELDEKEKPVSLYSLKPLSDPRQTDLNDITERLGISVIYVDADHIPGRELGVRDGCSYATGKPEAPYEIRLRIGLTRRRKRFVVAHELGHIVLGHCDQDSMDYYLEHRDEIEAAADYIAFLLLMPEHTFEDNWWKPRSELAKIYGVSKDDVRIRLLWVMRELREPELDWQRGEE